ncbi:hypothetical protein W97_02875 [Coniosporium apollinis CBS 100218]|uniref:FYVE-type domain-containing protein n=1 Tax=Coniosporium apollinis (strain CBS 100218) TaxID=1168221 RepID=R7YP34_CONA1|nr:uncharacterized protein W97_02875 [Coniosporium apollinis CBS 100218]EON63647.1 hypothetical protein W97_02875 [Coniosporium apollinis CBS 100218]
MTSRRSLGGGRILGNGRSISPAVAPSSPLLKPQHQRNVSLLSPSESSVSLSSQPSTSPASTVDTQDISSNVALDHPDNAAAASASSKLMTLLQLNRHLDDLHQNLEEVEQDEVKTWFKAQMTKAKKFQPLAVLNQKLKGLDVFESNDPPAPPVASNPGSGTSTPEPRRPDPDEVVTRAHWQKPTSSVFGDAVDTCSEPTCGRRLGVTNGTVNCRKCGKLFCEDHTMYQMKLSRSAQHEPVRGFWCRVCETCYKSRDGYNDHGGFTRDHTEEFVALRRKRVDKAYLEVGRLEARLTKLTQLLASAPVEQGAGGYLASWGLSSVKAQQRQLEQSIIAWEDDATVPRCPFCQQEFSQYSFRRHHCRLCGRVVCGDPRTGCSSEVGLNVAAQKPRQLALDIRMCRDCKHTLFSKSDFARELAQKPPVQRAYENLQQFERGIRLLMPKFQRLLITLQDPDRPPSSQQLQDATKTRKRLMDAFAQYDTAARRIRDLPTESAVQQKLQKAVYTQAYNFLSLHMLPLKALPKILKHAAPNGAVKSQLLNGRPSLAAIKQLNGDSGSVISSSASVSQMEAEEKELRERLIVLEEQKFFVQEMLADATRHRRFDEVKALSGNVEDLSREIDQINGQLGQLDFAAAYAGG